MQVKESLGPPVSEYEEIEKKNYIFSIEVIGEYQQFEVLLQKLIATTNN